MSWGRRWEALSRGVALVTYRMLVPLVAVLVLAMGLADLPGAVRAARGEGLPGTFVAEERLCSRAVCSWSGTFTSRDGSVRLADATLDTDAPPDRPGGGPLRGRS